MGREKEGFREILMMLKESYPLLLSKCETCKALGVSKPHLDKLIASGKITFADGKVPIGSVARYLCG